MADIQSLANVLQNPQNAQLFLDINGLSKHIGTNKEFNELNYGGGLTYEKPNADGLIKILSGGGYKNSENNNSYYAGAGLAKRFPITKNISIDAGGLAGVLSGYSKKLTPAIMPSVSLNFKDRLKLRALYGIETDTNPAVLMMNLGIPIK